MPTVDELCEFLDALPPSTTLFVLDPSSPGGLMPMALELVAVDAEGRPHQGPIEGWKSGGLALVAYPDSEDHAEVPDALAIFRDTKADGAGQTCARCGCTELHACEGGCYWVPNELNLDLCSACCASSLKGPPQDEGGGDPHATIDW